jgi:pyrroline-5-carboxylate reductase
MEQAGIELGLAKETARQLAVQTCLGAATMLSANTAGTGSRDTMNRRMVGHENLDPATLRKNVTSEGGTTAAAIRSLEQSGIRSVFKDAMVACISRYEIGVRRHSRLLQ